MPEILAAAAAALSGVDCEGRQERLRHYKDLNILEGSLTLLWVVAQSKRVFPEQGKRGLVSRSEKSHLSDRQLGSTDLGTSRPEFPAHRQG